jgi:hypothetical protein
MPCFARHEDGTAVSVRVIPRAPKTLVQGLLGDALKVRLAAPPVEGAANRELQEFFAGALGIARNRVQILAGATGRNKRVLLAGVAPEAARKALLRSV